ncbi:hypothetical protein [Lacipirellula parvula]|uniref:Uncharacterized protein n=1 Tax=Lacipirellula parvula TaxID=2650471 RepID=A0A5K7XPX2_9BACT|nr:hypothetical protein [Lacipirellula parvula]BBO35529.1 hypothetical protein PLANPX_5141 [Lacipirellula parvula]
MVRILLAVFIGLVAVPCGAEEIPLKSIWSWGLPDTQLVTDIDPVVVEEVKKVPIRNAMTPLVVAAGLGDKSLTYKFVGAMKALDGKPGFAVPGHATEALRNAANTPLDAIPDTLPAGNVTLVFSSPRTADKLSIQKVVRTGNKIEIQYGLASRGGHFVDSDYFALIPLGELRPGKYDVAISTEQKPRRSAQHISKPFSFTVE